MPPKSWESSNAAAGADASASAGAKSSTRGWLRLLAVGAGVAAVWCLVLPWLAAQPALQRRIDFLETRRVDPSAMFYTELEAMDEVHKRMTEIHRRHSAALWKP